MSYHQADIIGKKYGRWTVLSYIEKKIYGHYYTCKCDCGNEKAVFRGSLIYGKSFSCGCFNIEESIKNAKHGHSRTRTTGTTREYYSWQHMKGRCLKTTNKSYKCYGGRGIIVCDRWQGEHGFENFLDDMGEMPKGYSIERKDVNGNYEPSNCFWLPKNLQGKNTRLNRWIEHQGKRLIMSDWAKEFKVDCRTLHRLLKKRSFAYCYEYYTKGQYTRKYVRKAVQTEPNF